MARWSDNGIARSGGMIKRVADSRCIHSTLLPTLTISIPAWRELLHFPGLQSNSHVVKRLSSPTPQKLVNNTDGQYGGEWKRKRMKQR